MKTHARLLVASLATFVLAVFVTSSAALAQQHPGDDPATHNMLVVGEKTVYLSHLPMFQEKGQPVMPHRYQAILEVTFTKEGGDPQHEYAKDREDHQATKIYTLNPEKFVLPSLVAAGTESGPQRSFKGKPSFVAI